jgi:hypothetical protein
VTGFKPLLNVNSPFLIRGLEGESTMPNAAAKSFMKKYDRFTIALCGTAAVAYAAAKYFDLEDAPEDFSVIGWFKGDYDAVAAERRDAESKSK